MSKNISWNDQRTFLTVLQEGSLSGAARYLGVSQPTVRSRIEALEAALGTALFTRSVNGLTPTKSALALREPAQTMATASQVFIRQASAPIGEIAGVVRLSVPDFMGIEVVPSMLAQLRQDYPLIHIELSLSNVPADLLAQEVDIAVRTVAPKHEVLLAKKVRSIPLGFFASKAYLERRGMPQTMDELAEHDFIGPDRSLVDLALVSQLSPVNSRERFVLRTDSHPAQLAAARAGIGIAAVQVPVGQRDPGLLRVLPQFTLAKLDTWIVTHENLRKIPRVAAVFDSFVSAFENLKNT